MVRELCGSAIILLAAIGFWSLRAAALGAAPASQPSTVPGGGLPAFAPASLPSTVPSSRPAVVSQTYRWRLMADAAGGNCTGIRFNSLDASIRFLASGDIGGYRWDYDSQRWASITDWNPDPAYGRMIGLVINSQDRDVVYYAAGHPRAEIFSSVDRGRTFIPSDLQKPNGKAVFGDGGEEAAASGERLVTDPNNKQVLFYASRLDGLWCSTRASAPGSWKQVESFSARGDVDNVFDDRGKVIRKPAVSGGLSLVMVDRHGGVIDIDGVRRSRVIYVGVVGDRREQRGGNGGPVDRILEGGLWRSNDGGQTWVLLAGPLDADNAPARGVVSLDGVVWATINGRVVRTSRDEPRVRNMSAPAAADGYFAVMVDPADANHVIAARRGDAPADRPYGEANGLFRTTDAGATWKEIKAEAVSPPWWGKFATRTNVLRFEANAPNDAQGRSRTLWLGDAIGAWVCGDLDADVTHWKLISHGRGGPEITSVACPPPKAGGPIAPVLATALGVGGFRYSAFTAGPLSQLTRGVADTTPALVDGGCVAFCENEPNFVAAVGRRGAGVGGDGAASADNGVTWTDFADGGAAPVDAPRMGRIAVSSTKQPNGFPILVWAPSGDHLRFSLDWGKTWKMCEGTPPAIEAMASAPSQSLAADSVDGQTFYFFSDNCDASGFGKTFVSADGGANWTESSRIVYGSSRRRVADHQIVAEPGKTGNVWLCFSDAYAPTKREPSEGFYRSTDLGKKWTKLARWDAAYGFAFGAPAPGRTNPSLVVAGKLDNKLGVFISDDATADRGDLSGATWRQIWESFGDDLPSIIHCLRVVGADRQSYGRIYLGSNGAGRGLFYGEPVARAAPAAPTNLTATTAGGRVTLEWTDPVGAAEYDVQRAPAEMPTQWQTVVSTAWQSRIVDQQVEAGKKYVYRVIASNALGRSDAATIGPIQAGP